MKVYARIKVTRQQVQYAYAGRFGLWRRNSPSNPWEFYKPAVGVLFHRITNNLGMDFVELPDDAEFVMTFKHSNMKYPFCGFTFKEVQDILSEKGLPPEDEEKSEKRMQQAKEASDRRKAKADKIKAEALEGDEEAQKKARERLIKRAAERAAKKKAIRQAIDIMAANHLSDIPREGKGRVVYAYYRTDTKGTQYAHCGEFGLWQWLTRKKQWVLRSRRPQRWFGGLAGSAFEGAFELPSHGGKACTIKDSKGYPFAGLTIEQLKAMADSTNS